MLDLDDVRVPRDTMKKHNDKLAYFPSWYRHFGCGENKEELGKLLPCIGEIEKNSGDNFYYFTLFTKKGKIKSCGYYDWIMIEDLEKPFNPPFKKR